jgi:hypothetical protein
MFRLCYNLGMLAAETQQVMWLRAMKLTGGRRGADAEARRMVSEKVIAAAQATGKLMRGGSPESVVAGYRKKVRANRRRLAR